MKVAGIGTGHVGLTSASPSRRSGTMSWGPMRIQRRWTCSAGHPPFHDTDLQELLRANMENGQLSFTSDIAEAVSDAEVAFI